MATYYYQSGCDGAPQTPYACSGCLTRELARVRSIAFVKDSYLATLLADPTSGTVWSAGITSLNIIVLYKVNGEYDGGETEEIDGFGDSPFDNGNTTHTMTINDPHVADNWDFYNYIRQTSDWIPVLKTSTKIWLFEEPANIKVKMPIANDIKAVVTNQLVIKVVQDGLPVPYTIPAGIFDSCLIAQ